MVFTWKPVIFGKTGSFCENWWFSWNPYFQSCPRQVLQLTLLKEEGVCAHWWPNLTLLLNHFYTSLTEEGSMLDYYCHRMRFSFIIKCEGFSFETKTNQKRICLLNKIRLGRIHRRILCLLRSNSAHIYKKSISTFISKNIKYSFESANCKQIIIKLQNLQIILLPTFW